MEAKAEEISEAAAQSAWFSEPDPKFLQAHKEVSQPGSTGNGLPPQPWISPALLAPTELLLPLLLDSLTQEGLMLSFWAPQVTIYKAAGHQMKKNHQLVRFVALQGYLK